ncbi:MAG: hypothetical protein CSB55_01010 [Candidatus Cloacimonadota bacterium]|nr:MAG: hypothetical protein CSB55_01010 [Candidatus Cloacimonadota bacterium]
MTGLDWKINKLYSVGLSYKNEDRQDYFKLNFEARFPYPELKHRISASSEKVTYNPVFSFFNYWQVGLGYDIYYDSNLGNQNLELDIIYEYPGSETPVIKVSELNNDTEEQNLSFEVTGASRYRNINVKLNDEEVFLKQYLWDDDCKKFDIPIKLTATNNQIEISAVSVNGETCSEIIDIDLSSLAIVSEPEPVIQDTVETEEIVASVIEDSVEVVKVKPEVIHQEPVITDIVIISIPKSYRKNGNVPYLYTVKKGDNLWNIAKKKNVFGNPFKWVQLDLKNGLVIKNPDLIYPGQIIYIENNSVYDDFVEKTVKKGDNIWDLSHEMVKDIKDRDILIMANKETMKRPDIIQPGQKISFKLFIVK